MRRYQLALFGKRTGTKKHPGKDIARIFEEKQIIHNNANRQEQSLKKCVPDVFNLKSKPQACVAFVGCFIMKSDIEKELFGGSPIICEGWGGG